MRYYTLQIGCRELTGWFPSNDRVRRVAARWVRLFWPKWVATLQKGSIAYQDATDDPQVSIYRHWWINENVISFQVSRIDGWALEANGCIK